MDSLTLAFHDEALEQSYLERTFRAAYYLQISYTLSLLSMFLLGTLIPSFAIASWFLGPGFFFILVARIWLHRSPDYGWACRCGRIMFMVADASIWVTSAIIFQRFELQATPLLYSWYCVAMVLYPIILMVRTLDFMSRSILLLIAMGSTAATPCWMPTLSQVEFVITNFSTLCTGALFAYFMERLKRENELMHVAQMTSARTTTTADSRLNHVLKNLFVVIDHHLDLARTELEVPTSACAAPCPAPADAPRLGLDLPAPDLSRQAAAELLLSAQTSLQSCVDWIHKREVPWLCPRSNPQRCLLSHAMPLP